MAQLKNGTKLLAEATQASPNGYSRYCTLIEYGTYIKLKIVEVDYNGKVVDTRTYIWYNTPQFVLVAKSYMELETA